MAIQKRSRAKTMAKAAPKRRPTRMTPRKSKDVPVTQEMLYEVRAELQHSIVSLESKMESKFKSVDGRFDLIDSKFEKVLAEVHRVGLLVEEQNSRNRFVLDGYASLDERGPP
jgi:hypothetical protein